MAIVQHGTVHHSFMVLSKVLQVLIVGGYHAKGFLLPKLFQHSLCYGAANGGLCAATKLVYQQQRVFVGLFHHLLHVHQMTRVCTQVVLYALLVAYVDHYALECAYCRAFAYGDGQSALQHVLQ